MTEKEFETLTIEKKREMRTREIANMISEGGIGAENYYVIKKSKYTSDQHENRNEE